MSLAPPAPPPTHTPNHHRATDIFRCFIVKTVVKHKPRRARHKTSLYNRSSHTTTTSTTVSDNPGRNGTQNDDSKMGNGHSFFRPCHPRHSRTLVVLALIVTVEPLWHNSFMCALKNKFNSLFYTFNENVMVETGPVQNMQNIQSHRWCFSRHSEN